MNLKRLEIELSKLGSGITNLSWLRAEAGRMKDHAISRSDENLANKLWVYETIIDVHVFYTEAFNLLKKRAYLNGWISLEKAEIQISALKKHLHLVKDNFKIRFVENMVAKYQTLFPYRLFSSSEFLEQEITCSICDQKISLRQSCGHRIGELYMGEYCLRNITKAELLGIAVVQNPVNKYAALFAESDDLQYRDQVQFGTLNYILAVVKSPYDNWSVEIKETYFPHENHKNLEATDSCPCNSGKKYFDCCLPLPGVHGFHYEFILSNKLLARAKVIERYIPLYLKFRPVSK
jgi:hypothetical protein